MAQFTNLFPTENQTDVTRTSIIRFSVLIDSYGVNIGSLGMKINNDQVILNGGFVNNYRGNVYPSSDKYTVGVFPKSPSFLPYASDIKVSLNVLDSYGSLVSTIYHFYTDGYEKPPVPPIPPHGDGSRACLVNKPSFYPTETGLRLAKDTGIGTEAELSWKPASPFDQDDIVLYNIYYSTENEGVFDTSPNFLIDGMSATIGGLPPGDSHYFGVRAAEFNPVIFTATGLRQAGPDMYFYPIEQLTNDMSASDLFVPCSTDGFPNYGILLIGTELIRYTSLQLSPAGFVVPTNGRGYTGTGTELHYANDDVRLYHGSEDGNEILVTVTPTFQKPNYALTWQLSDGYDSYDGYDKTGKDGYYRYNQNPDDSLTTDGYVNDSMGEFKRFDYCGTYRNLPPYSFMKGQCRGSYFGGAQVRVDAQGNRHLVKEANVETHLLQREELLLETTGEPIILLKRMWTGIRCLCFMNRKEHPDARCPICFGTSYISGFGQFFNNRRQDRKILVRLDPTDDDLNIDQNGLTPIFDPSGWTLAYPMIKDRDIMVRFNADGTEEFRYEILKVNRNKTMFTQMGAQKFNLKRIPKTDIIYQFPVLRSVGLLPATIHTSVNSGPGLSAHSHGIVVPNSYDPARLSVATMEFNGHNHIIVNGRLYEVLGHSHSLPLL